MRAETQESCRQLTVTIYYKGSCSYRNISVTKAQEKLRYSSRLKWQANKMININHDRTLDPELERENVEKALFSWIKSWNSDGIIIILAAKYTEVENCSVVMEGIIFLLGNRHRNTKGQRAGTLTFKWVIKTVYHLSIFINHLCIYLYLLSNLSIYLSIHPYLSLHLSSIYTCYLSIHPIHPTIVRIYHLPMYLFIPAIYIYVSIHQ